MAAQCPNPDCKRQLKLKDWRETCPDCGVNLLYYGLEEGMEREADEVELAAAVTQKKYDRAKAALIGSPLAIVRLVFLVLPLAAIVPLVTGKLMLAMPNDLKTIVLGILNIFTGFADFNADFQRLDAAGRTWFLLLVAGVLIMAVTALIGLVTCFLGASPKWFARGAAVSTVGMASAALSSVGLSQLARYAESTPTAFIICVCGAFLAFALILGINLIINKRGGLPVKYTPCFIAGIPEEEVLAYVAQGGTVENLRVQTQAAEKAAEADEAAADEETAAEEITATETVPV